MTNLEVLVADRCTRKEAEKLLEKGTIVFEKEEFVKNFDSYMEQWYADEEEIEKYKDMIESNEPPTDWSIVTTEDGTYYVMYVM